MKTVLSATHLIAAGVIAGAFTVGFLAGPALAAEPQAEADVFQFKFQYEPEELQSSDGAKKLLGRLESQVARRCGAGPRMPLTERRLVKDCVEETMTKAVNGFGSSAVAEAYRSRTGG